MSNSANIHQFNDSGFSFILAEDHAIANIMIGIALGRGATGDPIGKEGLTYLTMEMLMRGTQRQTHHEFSEAIDFMGSTISTSIGYDNLTIGGETLYRFRDEYLQLLSEALCSPSFLETELDKLRQETKDLLRLSTNDDNSLGHRHFVRHALKGHPYGRPAIGSYASLDAITIEDIKDLHKQLLQKGQLLVYAAGDIGEQELSELVGKYFSAIPDGISSRLEVTEPKKLSERKLVIVDKPDRTQIQLFIGQPSINASHKDFYAMAVTDTAFGGFFESRYALEIRKKRGWSYYAGTSLPLYRHGGLFYLNTFTSTKNLAAAVEKSLTMLEELAHDGLTDEELEKAKGNLINEYPFKLDTAEKRVRQWLRIWAYDIRDDYLETYRSRIAEVSLADTKKAANTHIDGKNNVIVAVCAASECRSTLESAIDSLASIEVVPYDVL